MKITNRKFLSINDEVFEINSNWSGCMVKPLKEMLHEVLVIRQYYSKVFYMRFDLRINKYTVSNEPVTKFLKKFKGKLFRECNLNKLCFIWCREIDTSEQQHYHFMIGIDGQKVKYSERIIAIIEHIWAVEMGYHWIPENCFYFVRRDKENYEDKLRGVIYRASYLSKPRTKEFSNQKAKNYGRSRLKAKEPINITFR